MTNKRDCEHGSQIGKCDTCDLFEAYDEIESLRTQLAKANERVKELEKNSKDSFVSFAKKHNTVDGSTALFIHALAVAFDKEQLRKEQLND